MVSISTSDPFRLYHIKALTYDVYFFNFTHLIFTIFNLLYVIYTTHDFQMTAYFYNVPFDVIDYDTCWHDHGIIKTDRKNSMYISQTLVGIKKLVKVFERMTIQYRTTFELLLIPEFESFKIIMFETVNTWNNLYVYNFRIKYLYTFIYT